MTPDAEEEESESVDGAESNVMSDQEEDIIESFFDDGATGIAYLELKGMLGCTNIGSIAPYAVKIMELLQIGKIEKGSLQPEGKFQSIVGRWFKCKPKTRVGSGNAETEIREGVVSISTETVSYQSSVNGERMCRFSCIEYLQYLANTTTNGLLIGIVTLSCLRRVLRSLRF